MTTRLSVHFLPTWTSPDALAEGTVVVLDVLRASTTIIQALAAGAREVVPCAEVGEAKAIAAHYPREEVVLGGERGGVKVPGFDLGNSPEEYVPDRVAGKTVVFTSTNGTQALLRCRQARRVLIGGLVNLPAVTTALCEDSDHPIHILCAGTDGRVTLEDTYVAGLFVEAWLARQERIVGRTWLDPDLPCDDAARIALRIVQEERGSLSDSQLVVRGPTLAEVFRVGLGGKTLLALGHDHDLQFAAQRGAQQIVPELNLATARIRRSVSDLYD